MKDLRNKRKNAKKTAFKRKHSFSLKAVFLGLSMIKKLQLLHIQLSLPLRLSDDIHLIQHLGFYPECLN